MKQSDRERVVELEGQLRVVGKRYRRVVRELKEANSVIKEAREWWKRQDARIRELEAASKKA